MLQTEHISEILDVLTELSQQIADDDYIYLHFKDLTSV